MWKTKGNGSKNELFVHLNMNAAFANAPAAEMCIKSLFNSILKRFPLLETNHYFLETFFPTLTHAANYNQAPHSGIFNVIE